MGRQHLTAGRSVAPDTNGNFKNISSAVEMKIAKITKIIMKHICLVTIN